ncbi:Proteinase inhibitor I25 [Macleaya cordata]|uniref:Proteinase inhibitor I25 n=1 Tax=Macleaya cordata TaxID=56857 RepID=A0A200QDV1_MACCD|nr:Proteinase inhibitor I25 [Macleaya cordata]
MAGSVSVFFGFSSSLFITISFLLFLCFVSSLSTVNGVGFGGGKLGGKTEIKDVETNKEIQELGSFSVNEYNLKFKREKGTSLTFSEVVKAEEQVVAGTKYFLKISAVQNGDVGENKMFDAVVVVKPWVHPSNELLSFDPSTTN